MGICLYAWDRLPPRQHLFAGSLIVVAGVASVYAVAMLRGRRERHHRLGYLLPFTVAALITPVQLGVGDWAAHPDLLPG